MQRPARKLAIKPQSASQHRCVWLFTLSYKVDGRVRVACPAGWYFLGKSASGIRRAPSGVVVIRKSAVGSSRCDAASRIHEASVCLSDRIGARTRSR